MSWVILEMARVFRVKQKPLGNLGTDFASDFQILESSIMSHLMVSSSVVTQRSIAKVLNITDSIYYIYYM